MGSGLQDHHLAPSERVGFAELLAKWADGLEHEAAMLLGEVG
jgi:hypothetical protein